MRPPRRRLSIAAGLTMAAVISVSACLLTRQDPGPLFSHEIHADVIGMACTVCHPGARASDRAGLPTRDVCLRCHGHEAPQPVSGELLMLPEFFDPDGRSLARPIADVPDEVRFSHRVHVAEQHLRCEDCHGDAGHGERIPPESAVTKRECMSCHDRTGADNGCSTCHQVVSRLWQPPSHDTAWDRMHGETVRAGEAASMHRCDLCHVAGTSCTPCHQSQQPEDHTNFWRLRGHGLTAALDRGRCSTCHRTDSCARCHESARPLSHRAGFGSPRNRHCVSCHFPLVDNGCATCHRATPSHQRATPMPGWHVPSMNCRQCHGTTAPLPHPDNGSVCTSCHR